KKNFWKGGRNVVFNQTVNFSYNVPTTKFPLIDWTTLRLKYGATYRWIGASRLAYNLGNFLENGQQEEANLQLDFNKLYGKSKWLKAIDQPREPSQNAKSNGRDSSVAKKPNLLPQTKKGAAALPE